MEKNKEYGSGNDTFHEAETQKTPPIGRCLFYPAVRTVGDAGEAFRLTGTGNPSTTKGKIGGVGNGFIRSVRNLPEGGMYKCIPYKKGTTYY